MLAATLPIQAAVTHATYTRVHRPEDYTKDLLRYVATEVNVSPGLMVRFAPMADAMLKRWEDAAVEYSIFTFKDGKPVSVKTYYKITDYSSNKLFGLFTKLLTLMGVGKSIDAEDIDIAFVLLGGVLNVYGTAAGLDKDAIGQLDGFRLKNSDFLTCSEFGGGVVTITNLETRAVDTLDLDDGDVQKIVAYAHQFMTRDNKDKYRLLEDAEQPEDFAHYQDLYDKAHLGAKKHK